MVGRDIGEQIIARILDRTGIGTRQLVDEGTLAVDDGIQVGHILAQVFNFLSHGDAGRRNVVALADLEADTGIDHVFPAAEGTTDAEHRVFIGTIVSADSYGTGIFIIAITGCEIPLVIWIKVQRMEGCQGSGTGTDAVDAGTQLVDGTTEVGYRLIRRIQLADIDRIPRSLARSHIVDLVAAHVDVAVLNGDVAIFVASLDGEATVVDGRIARRDAVGFNAIDTFEVLSQFDLQFGIIAIL